MTAAIGPRYHLSLTLGTRVAWQAVPLTGEDHEGVGIEACMFGAVLS